MPDLQDPGHFIVVIPSRYASSRLYGKPLKDIAGRPMIEHVWRLACQSAAARVIIATDDERIAASARGFGAEVVMTAADHENGTARLEEVARHLALPADTCIVNVQGDEPLLPPELIDLVAASLARNENASIATLAEPITSISTLARPSVVKVVRDIQGRALYFSRAPIPWQRDQWGEQGPCDTAAAQDTLPAADSQDHGWLRHVGLYGYRASFLYEYARWKTAPQEALEQLEQLRALYHGHQIQVEVTSVEYPAGVDTAEDLERVRGIFSAFNDS